MFGWNYNKTIFKDVEHNSMFDLCNIDPSDLGYGVVIFYNQPDEDTLFAILKRRVGFVLIKIESGRSSGPILSGKTLANTFFKSNIYLKELRQ
jgi:hypothetical protein